MVLFLFRFIDQLIIYVKNRNSYGSVPVSGVWLHLLWNHAMKQRYETGHETKVWNKRYETLISKRYETCSNLMVWLIIFFRLVSYYETSPASKTDAWSGFIVWNSPTSKMNSWYETIIWNMCMKQTVWNTCMKHRYETKACFIGLVTLWNWSAPARTHPFRSLHPWARASRRKSRGTHRKWYRQAE